MGDLENPKLRISAWVDLKFEKTPKEIVRKKFSSYLSDN